MTSPYRSSARETQRPSTPAASDKAAMVLVAVILTLVAILIIDRVTDTSPGGPGTSTELGPHRAGGGQATHRGRH